ncbi:MAG: hypothetical protein JJU00_12785 [Opitutales bacterium]|nr:hypothetical protein [Opitutales bacterium]
MLPRLRFLLLFVVSCALTAGAVAMTGAREHIRYPAGGGFVIDVTQAPFNADPTGEADSSAAIMAASLHARTWPVGVPMFVYFPNGRYRIEEPVVLEERTPGGQYIMMQGESREGVTLFVPDNTPAFANGGTPRPVVSYFEGDWTNNGFLNTFENFTVEVGAGNPGAVAVRFQGNNVTRMSNVTIRSLDPAGVGAVGLDISTNISAPAIVENVRIEGFEIGVKTDSPTTSVYSWVLKDMELIGQRSAGIRLYRRPLTIYNLYSENTVPVLNSVFRDGNIVIMNADLRTPEGETADGPALITTGDFIYLRHVTQEGYAYLLDDNGTVVESTGVDGSFRNGPAYKVWEDAPEDFLWLDEPEFPEVEWDAPEDWLVLDPAGRSDHTEYLREAMESGAETIFLKPGPFTVSDTIRIGPSVKRIASNYAQINLTFPLTGSGKPVFELGVSDHPAVIIEQIWGNWQQNLREYFIHNRSNADLILKDIFWISGGVYRNDPSTGRLFVYNVCNVPGGQQFRPDLASWVIHDQQSWAFQFNPEMALPMLVMSGGDFWMFGAKFGEKQGPMIYAYDQARFELLGGVMNVSHGEELEPFDTAIFVVEDAQITVSALERAVEVNGPPNWNFRHRFISDEYREGERRRLPTTDPMVVHRDTLSRAGPGAAGALMPLYTSRYADDPASSAPDVSVFHTRVGDLQDGALLLAEVEGNGPGVPSVHWSRVSGPGEVAFDDPAAPSARAHFSRVGDYELGVRVRNGLHETFEVFPLTVTLGESVVLQPMRGQFRRIDDRAPRNGQGNAAIEALLLRTGDEAASGQAQDTEVRIHMELDIYRLRGAEDAIRAAQFEVTPRALVNPLDVDVYHVRGPAFGVVNAQDFARAAKPVATADADVFTLDQTHAFDVAEPLRLSIGNEETFLGLQLRSIPNDDGENNYVEWYSPDATVSQGHRPALVVEGATTGLSFWDGFVGYAADEVYHPDLGRYTLLAGDWAWSADLGRYFHVPTGTLASAWMWTEGFGWLWTRRDLYPWFYANDSDTWLYAHGSGNTSNFYDTSSGEWLP